MYSRCHRLASVLRLAVVLAAGSVVLTACATHANLPVLETRRNNAGVDAVYRLSVGDQLKIKVFGETELSGTYEVNAAGFVAFPLVGSVRAAGLTAAGFHARLRRKLGNGYLKRPRLTVDVTTYRPIYVHGEVRKGGEHSFKTGLKLRDAIALAGGYTYRADESYVIISRANGSRRYRVFLPSNMNVMPGDNIRVPERFF